MIVPIFAQDLNAGNGFNSLAQCLQSDWLGEDPITPAFAHDLLARCLGYQNFHQVTSSIISPDEVTDVPPLGDVLSRSVATIASELISGGHCRVFNCGELLTQIYGWPFLQLSVYRDQYGHTDMSSVAKTILAETMRKFVGADTPFPERELRLPDWEFTSKQLQKDL